VYGANNQIIRSKKQPKNERTKKHNVTVKMNVIENDSLYMNKKSNE
jgi:hypothetical protein